jgi:hypothetical protein
MKCKYNNIINSVFFPYFGNGASTGQIGGKSIGLTQIGNFILDAKYLLGIILSRET